MNTYEENLSNNALFKDSMIDNFLLKGRNERESVPSHPVAQMQNHGFKKDEMNRMRRYADLYGTGYAFQLCMERNFIASYRRMYPLKSNNLGLNIHMGNYDKIEFTDFLGKNKPFDVDESLFRKTEKIYFD